jgi:hypothetical protein
MADAGSLGELRGLLRAELTLRLGEAGWGAVDPAASSLSEMDAFIRPVSHEFASTLEVFSSAAPRPPLRVTHVSVGVSYEPLRRLWPLLDRFGVSVLAEDVRYVEEDGSIRDDDDEDDDDDWQLEIVRAGDVPGAADELTRLMLDRALPFAERHASLDALLAEFEGDDPDDVHPTVPALLAGAGRFDEARAALDRSRPDEGFSDPTRSASRYARQLGRWIDSRGDPALIPASPPPPLVELQPNKSLSQIWRETRAKEDAIAAVKGAGEGRDRDALREMLESELEQHGLSESPLWFEQTLDQLTASSSEQAKHSAEGLKALGRLGLSLVTAIRERELPDLSRPDWVEPPNRAAYAVPSNHWNEWTAVHLDTEARDWLDQIRSAVPRLADEPTTLNVWLERQPNPGHEHLLAAHIGEHRVGTIDGNATSAFGPVMDAAAERDELPYATARLTPRPTPVGYLLELQLPRAAN